MSASFSTDPQQGRLRAPSRDAGSADGLRRMTARRRRASRGRLGRGALLPPFAPAALTRQQQFEEYVSESAGRLADRWGTRIEALRFEVAQVPDERSLAAAAARSEAPPLGTTHPARDSSPARVIVFRRPIEIVAGDSAVLPWLVHDVVVELVAEVLLMAPEDLDPDYRGDDPPGLSD